MADLKNYYFGPWQRDAEQGAWVAPDGTVGLLDFGSLNDCSLSPSAIDQRGIGLFCVPRGTTMPSEYDLLDSGDCREIQVTPAHINLVEAVLGVRIDAIGKTLAQACADLFAAGDPTGLERWKPLTPTREGVYEIHLGGHSTIFARKFDGPADKTWNKQRDQLRYDLGQHDKECKAAAKALKELAKELRKQKKTKEADACDARAAKAEFHAEKALDAMCRKYRCLPSELSTTIRRGKASTTISDDFNRSNGALGANWGNATASTNYNVFSNGVRNSGSLGCVRFQTPLSASDYYVQHAVIDNDSSLNGVAARMANSTAYTCYAQGYYGDEYIIKFVTGSQTNLANGGNHTAVAGTRKFDCSGSTLTAFWNSSQACQATDSTHSGLYAGLHQAYITLCDNFEASDGIADFAPKPRVIGGGFL